MDKHNKSKRDFLKTVAYVAPVIATFSVAPAVASIGSYADEKRPKRHHGHKRDHGHSGYGHKKRKEKSNKFFAKENGFFHRKERD